MNIVSILPVTPEETKIFKSNPRLWIEAKLEVLRPHSPLIQAVFNAIIESNLTDREFYLFLSFYAVDRVIRLEQELQRRQGIPKPPKVKRERIKL